jgi:hypothetical protein
MKKYSLPGSVTAAAEEATEKLVKGVKSTPQALKREHISTA